MPMLGEQLEAPQLTLHISMSVAQRLLADIEEWTYSMLYSIRWMLVLRDFTRINLWKHTNWPLESLVYFDIVPARTIRTKNVFIHICGRASAVRTIVHFYVYKYKYVN